MGWVHELLHFTNEKPLAINRILLQLKQRRNECSETCTACASVAGVERGAGMLRKCYFAATYLSWPRSFGASSAAVLQKQVKFSLGVIAKGRSQWTSTSFKCQQYLRKENTAVFCFVQRNDK